MFKVDFHLSTSGDYTNMWKDGVYEIELKYIEVRNEKLEVGEAERIW